MQNHFRVSRLIGGTLLLGWCLWAHVPAQAATMRLADLLDNQGTITSGDKVFSEFTYAHTGDMPLPENINVITIQDLDGNYGIRFQGGFVDAPDAATQASDALITFKVAPNIAGRLISDAHLAANIVARDGGTGTITETFLPIFRSTDEILRIPTGDSELIDSIVFDEPQPWLLVQKNILLRAVESQVDISFIDQTFSQVPEPSAAALLVTGGLAVSLRRRRGTR